MATERVKLDARGNNILSMFENNMSELGALNQLAASLKDSGVYHGPAGDVNINYPENFQGNVIGSSPNEYEKYYIREVYWDSRHGGMVTKDKFSGKSTNEVLQTHGAYSNQAGQADPSKFMELKGRKSLFTLLQETRAAFFDNKNRPVYRDPSPASTSPTNQSNEYGDNYQSYDYQYMENQGRSFVDPPQGIDFTIQALVGFNLGQALGGNVTILDRIHTEAQNITRNMFLNLGAEAGAEENQYIADYYNRLAGVMAPVERISQLYVPGWGRPSENWLTKKPLSENLNQNILLPPNSNENGNPTDVPGNNNDNGTGGPGFGLTEKTFQSLYTRNRSGKAGGVNIANPIFNNGVIAGTAVNLLQEPAIKGSLKDKIVNGAETAPEKVSVPFTFEEDDAQYLTYPKKETGFTSNGPTTSTDPSRMEPAVNDLATMNT